MDSVTGTGKVSELQTQEIWNWMSINPRKPYNYKTAKKFMKKFNKIRVIHFTILYKHTTFNKT